MASGINRFLSKREGKRNRGRGDQHDPQHHHLPHHPHPYPLTRKPFSTSSPELALKPSDPNSAADFYGLFDVHAPLATVAEEPKIKTLRRRILNSKGVLLRDAQILWALRSNASSGDLDAAYELLLAMSDASEGIVTPYDPRTKLLGAQNRQGVTCFLDATLFSMFSRLDSFEAMLYNSFNDVARNKLAFLLRLWVNLLRSGKLITTDITKVMQDTLAECGWAEAAELHQQDASEAFSFITGKLDLPLMTLKMDIYHTGKEDSNDDHKFINERLLEVAIPPDPTGQRSVITLEECLEDYFNNRIEVRRYLERRSTINSMRKTSAVHVETVELDGDQSPITPLSPSPSYASPTRPGANRTRAPSIIQERYIPPRNESGYSSLVPINSKDSAPMSRIGSVRKEVMMPAWQFFSLIPWYTDNVPTNDAQVAAHFSSKRPVLGLCLKRYSFTPAGKAIRLDTQVDIPVEIGVPHFIQDDRVEETGGLQGNFKLSLQSVVCHRGNSVDSGHYIALVRGSAAPWSSDGQLPETAKTWMRFDDLAPQRIAVVDIEKALKEETPYLLFYQILPIEGDPGSIAAGEEPLASVSEHNTSVSEISSESALTDNQTLSGRPSFEITLLEEPRGRSPTETRRTSVISFQDPPPEYTNGASLSVPNMVDPSSTPRPKSLSRTQSKASESSLGRTLSKLKRKSREVLPLDNPNQTEVHVTEISEPIMPTAHNGQTYASQTGSPHFSKQNTLQFQHQPPRTHKSEKSRSRISRSKMRGEKPDRECVVM
ncbi:uncharacterized protein A1O5_04821 [Cladophialophora psammophila CBS 110553]|uniref:ubiquitinyl hydrolase 1 n=1 Tax=Cladophialophora psammophila CBS 110553 TaxID=1182543 RepID=W9WVT9_9EURO|nr:uncharacterized protein A1O5_04821 [Cladophialophora psammophila CBS 110553]EXJ72317.1 hypothetical protein A1O5_04821 [Cladophialophora psammophila CBS 110553]